ncbi:MAG TPA: acyltransferase [Syntrophorhabdaceae bacterium]
MIPDRLLYMIRRAGSSNRRCRKHKTARFYRNTSIINNLGQDNAIVIGAFSHVKGELLTFGHGGAIKIGEYCYVGENTRIWSGKSITIGDRVLISHNCNIFDNDTHPLNPRERHEQFREIIATGHPRAVYLNDEEVVLEDDVLVGANVSILKGVKIGRGAVIGTGSVVIRDVPPFSVVVGNPAEVIREIPPEDRQ